MKNIHTSLRIIIGAAITLVVPAAEAEILTLSATTPSHAVSETFDIGALVPTFSTSVYTTYSGNAVLTLDGNPENVNLQLMVSNDNPLFHQDLVHILNTRADSSNCNLYLRYDSTTFDDTSLSSGISALVNSPWANNSGLGITGVTDENLSSFAAVVPEPSAAALMLGAAAMLGAVGLRRRYLQIRPL